MCRPLDNASAHATIASMFDQSKAEQVLELISNGESLRQVAANLGLSSEARIREWADLTPENAAQYARAMEFRADVHADRIEAVAHELLDGTRTDAQAARTAIDALKWTASKLRPKKYGDRVQVDADMRIEVTVNDPFAPAHAAAAVAQAAAMVTMAGNAAQAPGTPPLHVEASAGTGLQSLPAPEHNGPREYCQVPVTSADPADVPRGASQGTGDIRTDTVRISPRTGKPVRPYARRT